MALALKNKSHLVFGAGLIGCYLGGVMFARDLQVKLVCRATVKAKLQQGMWLSDYLGHQTYIKPNTLFFDSNTEPNCCDIIWLTVKCTGIHQALLDLAGYVAADTVILCCQNGLGSDAVVKQAFPNNLVLRVMVPFNVVELKVGYFHRGSQGQLTIETSTDCHSLSQSLMDVLNCELLPMALCADMTALLWAKLQLNLGNSVNALADIPVKAMLEQRAYRLVIAILMKELLLVTDAKGLDLPKVTSLPAHWIPRILRLPDFIFKRVANKMLAIDPTVKTSMWWDMSQGKPTEIDYLNGAVVAQGQALGILCPANQHISKLISLLQSAEHPPTKSALSRPVEAQHLLNLFDTPLN